MDYLFNFLMLYLSFFAADTVLVVVYFLVIKKQILKEKYNITKPSSEQEQNIIHAMDYFLGKQLMGFMYGVAVIPIMAVCLGPIVFYVIAVGHELIGTIVLLILTTVIIPILYIKLIERIVAMPILTPEIANQTVEVMSLKKQRECETEQSIINELSRNIVIEEFKLREMIKANSSNQNVDPINNK